MEAWNFRPVTSLNLIWWVKPSFSFASFQECNCIHWDILPKREHSKENWSGGLYESWCISIPNNFKKIKQKAINYKDRRRKESWWTAKIWTIPASDSSKKRFEFDRATISLSIWESFQKFQTWKPIFTLWLFRRYFILLGEFAW